jgi:MFS family permease
MSAFHRDRFTWLAYLLLGYFAYLQSALGPLMPFLRGELGLSYAVGALHLSAFALGMIGAGLSGARLATRWGRAAIFWGGAAGMAAGALLLMIGGSVWATIGGALVMGYLGTLLLVMIQATLADHHGARRATALTEANIMAMLCATLAPLMIGLFQRTVLGWRGALLLGLLAGALIVLRYRGAPLPARRAVDTASSRQRLPGAFWALWVVLILSVAMEWSLIGWSADFLDSVVGLGTETAAMLVSVFFMGAVLGRTANSRWTRHTPVRTLLLAMLGVVAAGFSLFWLAPLPVLAVIGLGICGFGVGALFPLGLSLALTVAAAQSDAASGWISLGSGLAILVAPFTLGWLADSYGMSRAFVVVIVLNVAAFVLVAIFGRIEGETRRLGD